MVQNALIEEAVRRVPQTPGWVGDMMWDAGRTVRTAVNLDVLDEMRRRLDEA